ncbi:MAG: hypothetical protein NVS2B7_25670 [Herpetosiphon sp.]
MALWLAKRIAGFTLAGLLRPASHPLRMFGSERSLGPRGWIQIVNFMLLDGLLLVVTRGVAAEFHVGKAARDGPILLTRIAVGLLVAGPLVTDPATMVSNQVRLHGIRHGLFGALVFSRAPIRCFVFCRRLRADPKWQTLQWWTLAAGVIIVCLKIGQLPSHALHAWVGLIQRIALITYLGWIWTFAWGLLTRKTRAA